MKRQKEPTWTTLVLEALRSSDDFMDYAMLIRETGGNYCQVSASCFSLREYRAIGVEITPDGKAWWYARPPEDDARTRHLDERTPESKPRKLRKYRRKGIPQGSA